MLNWFKDKWLRLKSYIKPIDLGLHYSADKAEGPSIDEGQEYKTTEARLDETLTRIALTAPKEASAEISMTEEIRVSLNKSLGDFKVLSIIVSKDANQSIMRLRHIETGRTIRISTATFRLFFSIKKVKS